MKRIIMVFTAVILAAWFSSCRTMQRYKEVKMPVTVDEQKGAEKTAKQAYESGNYMDAISYLNALVKKDPKNPVYWSQLGSAYAQMNQFSYAEYAYRKSLKFDPKNTKAMYNLSVIYGEKGDQRNAAKMVQRALKYDPKNPLLQASLGNILIDTEKYDKAKQVYSQIVEAKPDFDIGHYNLGVINFQERNLDEAEKNYEKVLELKPDDLEAKENLAAINIIQNEHEKAIERLKEVIDANPDDDITLENAYFNMGVAYLRMRSLPEALNAFETAIGIEPWDMAAYVNAAIIAEELGDKDKAVKYWQKYDRLLPVNKRKDEMKKRMTNMGVKEENKESK